MPAQIKEKAADFEAVETWFWKNLSYGDPPIYGADMHGSLFDPAMKVWNVNELNSILHKLLNENEVPGVLSGGLAVGDTVIKRPSPLNVLKDAYDHSCN